MVVFQIEHGTCQWKNKNAGRPMCGFGDRRFQRPHWKRTTFPKPARENRPFNTSLTKAVTELFTCSEGFEPRLDPSIAVAAIMAAIPPIVFWVRVIQAERRRRLEAEQKEREREVSS